MVTETEPNRAPAEHAQNSQKSRNRAPQILLIVILLLAGYYAVLAFSGLFDSSADVKVTGGTEPIGDDYITLDLRTVDVDLTTREIVGSILPIPNGTYEADLPGEISTGIRIEVVSGEETTSVVAFPGKSIVDPTALSLNLGRGDENYPFDKTEAKFEISVRDEATSEPIPFKLKIDNADRQWNLKAAQGDTFTDGERVVEPITISGGRDMLSIALVLFYLLSILIITLIAVVTIGSALLRKTLRFSNVIWLSATMLSFPALRETMPDAPPIGTALDYVVFFPCMALVGGMFVWTGIVMVWRESGLQRRKNSNDSYVSTAVDDLT